MDTTSICVCQLLAEVRSNKAGHRSVQLENSCANTVRDSFFPMAMIMGQVAAMEFFSSGGSDHLIENNTTHRTRHALVLEGAVAVMYLATTMLSAKTDPVGDAWCPLFHQSV